MREDELFDGQDDCEERGGYRDFEAQFERLALAGVTLVALLIGEAMIL